MPIILGISAFYHDSAAAIVVDGKIIAAAQEERFTRKKHDAAFPTHAIEYCLREANITAEQLDYVGFYDKPFLKFERLLETYLSFAPRGFRSFLRGIPVWLKQKLHLPREMNKGLNNAYRKRYVFTEHHESHAASAFFPSPFEEAAILTVDGVGEWTTASWGVGKGNRIQLTQELRFPHSLGLLYSAFTYFCGFRVNSGEYKLMGLAPYGQPKYVDLILEKLIDLKEDGSFRMDLSYFNYCHGLTMTNAKFARLFGGPPRAAEAELTEREMDLAASIQQVTEEIILRMARHICAETGQKKLCLAGGVALNCVANGRILRETEFDDIWIQPAAGDAGGALGVALFIEHQLLGTDRICDPLSSQRASYFGPEFSDDYAEKFFDSVKAVTKQFDHDDAMCEFVAGEIAGGKVVGWMQGRMEFGPRALGNRSILGDARSVEMQSVLNLKIKFRESFRPFAPSILQERVAEFFEMSPDAESPYMLLVAPICEAQRIVPNEQTANEQQTGFDQLQQQRSQIPAVTHVDYSARVQTVDANRQPLFHKLLKQFEQQTGSPVVINTSFNVRGEPIVCTPEDAYRCFMATNMDLLVVGNIVLQKSKQPQNKLPTKDDHLSQFPLD